MEANILLFINRTFCRWNAGLLFMGLLLFNLPVTAQPQSQEKFPTSASNVSNSGGMSMWIYPERIKADDDSYSSNYFSTVGTNFLSSYNYQFSIPSGSTIHGIKVSIGRYGDTGSQIRDEFIKLKKNGVFVGDNKAATSVFWPEAETLIEYGGETDLWGTTWTAAEINDIGFGVSIAISTLSQGSFLEAHVDYFKISVYYTPLDPSYCAGSAVDLMSYSNTTNPGNSLNAPDGLAAKLLNETSSIILDLTGEVTSRPLGGHITVSWRDADPSDNESPMAYYQYATTYSSATGYNWSTQTYYWVTSPTFVNQDLAVGENARYVLFRISSAYNKALDIDGVTYHCCLPPATPGVTVINNCQGSVLTATGTTGDLLWSTGETTLSITVTNVGTYTVTQTVGGCTSDPGSGYAAPKALPATPMVTVEDHCGESVLTATGTTGTLLWSTGETTPSITVTRAGTYTVTQTVGGCTSDPGEGVAAPKAIPPTPDITVEDNCGVSLLTATGTTGDLLWNTGETTASIMVTNEGTYTVKQTVEGCESAIASVDVMIDPLIQPAISIVSSDADNQICERTLVTFTAQPEITGGGTPSYQWYYNDITYASWNQQNWWSDELEDGDVVKCVMTVTGGTCLSTPTATSNVIKTTVYNSSLMPSVSIVSDDEDNTICERTLVTFTAIPANTNGGTVSYRWHYNDYSYEGWNQPFWWSDELEDGDVVKCEMTVSDAACYDGAVTMSNTIAIKVISSPMPWVSIVSSDADNSICPGTSVTFTATAENTGEGLVNYQWLKNGSTVGLDQNTYTCTDLADQDVVFCLIYETEFTCYSVGMGISNQITTTLMSKLEPWISIVSDDADNTICSGTSVTFTAATGNTGEGTVTYQWLKNGSKVGTNQNTFTLTTLADKDAVSCEMTITGGNCLTTPWATSNVQTLTVNQCCIPGQNDMFEPNNTLASAATINVDLPEISANILNSKDLDWFKFTTSSDGYYTINFNANGGKELVELSNAKGQKLRSGSKTDMIYNLLANTTYYIKIYDSKIKSASPCYSLSVGYSPVLQASGFIEYNVDLKEARIESVASGIVKIWPNPTQNEFELYNGNETQLLVRVLDVNGRTLETIKKVGPAETVVFGNRYAPGIYFVDTWQDGIHEIFKIVKQ